MAWHDNADWSFIPYHLQTSLKRYVDEGRIPGDLLVGILSNELDAVVEACDAKRFRQVPAIVGFIHMYVPMECYGSGLALQKWEERGGYNQVGEASL
jgi:hypothetical protein